MTTLYDLLGALPGDDADDLRDAFRQAVKGVHPDIRPDDPEAALKFRLIVYAMEVLRDPEQRAAYDHLLELARQELVSQQTAAKIRNFAFAMIGLASAVVVVLGVSLLSGSTSALLPPAGPTGGLSRPSPMTGSDSLAAAPTAGDGGTTLNDDAGSTRQDGTPEDFLTRWGLNDLNATIDPRADPAKPAETNDLTPPMDENASRAPAERAEIDPPSGAAGDQPRRSGADADKASVDRYAETPTALLEPETPIVPLPSPRPPAQRDATSDATAPIELRDEADPSAVMHARGIVAYHHGELEHALAAFSRAIELDPAFATAYVNRGIVLYRMGKLKLALADVARARRIDRAGRTSSAAVYRRRRRDATLIKSMEAAGF